MYALVEWLGEGKFNVIPLSRIKNPRKEFSRYSIGDNIVATCFGFPGLFNAVILDIGDDKKVLEKKLLVSKDSIAHSEKNGNNSSPMSKKRNSLGGSAEDCRSGDPSSTLALFPIPSIGLSTGYKDVDVYEDVPPKKRPEIQGDVNKGISTHPETSFSLISRNGVNCNRNLAAVPPKKRPIGDVNEAVASKKKSIGDVNKGKKKTPRMKKQNKETTEDSIDKKKARMENMRRLAKEMPFSLIKGNQQSDSSEEEELQPNKFLKKVEDNRDDNFRALNEIMGKTITTPKVRQVKRPFPKVNSGNSGIGETFRGTSQTASARHLGPHPYARSDSSSDESEFNIKGNTDNNICQSANCQWKAKYLKLLEGKNTIKPQEIENMDKKTTNKVEISPGSGVFISHFQRSLIYDGVTSRTKIASSLLRCLYNDEQLKSVLSPYKLPEAETIIPAILSSATRFRQNDLPDVNRKTLLKALQNVVTYANRDYEKMKTMRRLQQQLNKI